MRATPDLRWGPYKARAPRRTHRSSEPLRRRRIFQRGALALANQCQS